MKKIYVLVVFLLGGFVTGLQAQIAAWDFTGLGNVATWTATTFNTNLVSTAGANNVTRGAGAAASSGTNSFRTTGFQNDGIAVTNTDYFQVTIQAVTNYNVSLSSISARVTGTATYCELPGVSNQFAYSLDGTNFTLIGTSSVTIGTNQIFSIDVSAISALQNVASGTTITLRYYASGQTNSGGWGFYLPNVGDNGLSINGIVQSTYTWIGGDCDWLDNTIWTPTGYPGSNTAGNTDLAKFNSSMAYPSVGINMNSLGGQLYLGGIELTSAFTGSSFNIGNNSGTVDGNLYLNGTNINAVTNSIIRNASGSDFTINNISTGGTCNGTSGRTMGVVLNNTTNNVISVEGTGNVIINSIISGSNPMEKTGSGTGVLKLDATNTYTGNITISAGTVQLLNNSTLAAASSITVKSGGNLQISNSQSLANVTLESGATLTVDNSRTLNITGTLTVDVGATISTTGTITYAPAAALVYNGTGSRTTGIEWTSSTVNKVTIDNNAIIKVNTNHSVPGTLFLINGILDADTYSFSSTSSSFSINGTVRTANLNGITGTGTTFTGYIGSTFTPLLGPSSTIEYNASSGTQNITTAVDYVNLIASGGGTKVPGSFTSTNVSGTISILGDGTTLNVSNNSFGNTGTKFIMTGTSKYINGGNSTKPDASGAYTLSAGSTIEFTSTSATIIRVGVSAINYGNIIVSGSNVSLSSPTVSIKMQTGTTFTVTSTGTFNVKSTTGFTGAAGTAVSNTNNPTIDLQAGSTINYNDVAQPLTPRSDYYNVTISGSGAKTAASAFNIAGTFTRSGDASLATTSPTYGTNATLAYVDAVAGRTYTTGLEWPVTNPPTNLTVNLSGTGTRQVILNSNKTVAGAIALTAGELSIAANTLTANGAFSYGTGTLTGSSTSNLVLNGAAGTVSFTQTDATTRSLNNLTLGASGTATLGSELEVYGNVQVNNTAANAMDFDGKKVTLKSNTTNTATIDKLNATGSNLTGATNVTVERWIPMTNPGSGTGRRYQLLTPTVTTTTSIQANWMEGGQVTTVGGTNNPLAGYGTHITGSNVLTNHLDRTQTDQPSLYTTTNGNTPVYTAFTNAIGTLNALTGYFLFVRGGRDVSLSEFNTNQAAYGWVNLASSNTTLRANGTIQKGPISAFTNPFIGGTGAYNLVTNPYPAPIDWSLVNRSNVNGSYKYWDPHNGNRGGFVDVDNTGMTTPTGAGGNQYIQPGQAFFVIASGAGTPTIDIEEADKAVGNNNNPAFLVPPKNFSASLFYYEGGINRRLADGVRTIYDNTYSAAFTGAEDAVDMPNWDENMAIPRDGYNLVVDKRPEITSRDTMPLLITNLKVANYELEFTGESFNNDAITPTLIDNFTGNRTGLSISGTTVVPITVSSNPASAASNRFYVVFENTAGPLPIDMSSIKAYEKGSGIQVDWVMNTEQDMDRYEVEKSTDGRHFTKESTVASRGNSTIQVNYGWFDVNPIVGDNFYRIKSFEKSGANKYSSIVRVNISKGGSTDISIYPNPFEGTGFNLQMNKLSAGTYNLTMYNNLGQQVYSGTVQHGGGSGTQYINLGKDLAAGTYTVKISSGNTELVRTITKK